jgi:dynein heavy chain
MLSIIVREEDATLEDEKIRLINENSECKQKMNQIEEKILYLLANTEGSKMLDDEKLINSLTEAKQTSEEVTIRMKEARITVF